MVNSLQQKRKRICCAELNTLADETNCNKFSIIEKGCFGRLPLKKFLNN